MNRAGVIHYAVTKFMFIRYPAEFVYVGRVESEHIVVHRYSQAGVDVKGKLNGFLTGEISFEAESVSKRVLAVDG